MDAMPDNRATITANLTSDAEGKFELHGVPSEFGWTIQVIPTEFAAQTVALSSLVPGEEFPLEIALGLGGTVTGQVVDSEGQPVASAVVKAFLIGNSFGFDDNKVGNTICDATGRFELINMPLGRIALKADHVDYLESKRVDGEVLDSGVSSGFKIELGIGSQITGQISWPNGNPAAGVSVKADFDRAYLGGLTAFNALRGASGETVSDDKGHFELNGMGSGPFVVSSEARPLDKPPHPEDAEEPEDRSDWFTVRRESVQPSSVLELHLHAPLGITGRVVDDKENPLTKFSLHAVRKAKGGFGAIGMEEEREEFEAEDGSFFLGDLTEGNWELTVASDGFVSPEAFAISVPTDEEVLLPVVRAASISGRVVTPGGTPIANAVVTVDEAQIPFQTGMDAVDDRPKVESDETGFFELKNLPPGSTALLAEHDDYCKSAPTAFDIARARASKTPNSNCAKAVN